MDLGVRPQSQMIWGKEFAPELDIDHPDLPPVNRPVQGFKTKVVAKAKLENAEKAWLFTLPWSYAEAVKKTNNRQPRRREESSQGEAADISTSSGSDQEWNNVKESAEQNNDMKQNDESDKETQLNPDAAEFIPETQSTEKEEGKVILHEIEEKEESSVDDVNDSTDAEDIHEISLDHDEDAVDMESADCDKQIEEKVQNAKIDSSERLVDLSPCDPVNFHQDHFSKNEVNIEPFETVASCTFDEGNTMTKPDLIQDVMLKKDLSKDDCISFGNELNFEELVKKKVTYSENHFGNNELDLNLIDSGDLSVYKEKQNNYIQSAESEELEKLKNTNGTEMSVNSNNETDEDVGQIHEDENSIDFELKEFDSLKNLKTVEETEFEPEEILETASSFIIENDNSIVENNDCKDENEGLGEEEQFFEEQMDCEQPFTNGTGNESSNFEETGIFENEDTKTITNEVQSSEEPECNEEEFQNFYENEPINHNQATEDLEFENRLDISNSNTLPAFGVEEATQQVELENQIDIFNNQTSTEIGNEKTTEHLKLENHIDISNNKISPEVDNERATQDIELENQIDTSNNKISTEVDEGATHYTELKNQLDIFNNQTSDEEEKENIYNHKAEGSLSKTEEQETEFTGINILTERIDEDCKENATKDEMTGSMCESTDHDSSFEIIKEIPINEQTSEDNGIIENSEDERNEILEQEHVNEEIETNLDYTSEENKTINDDLKQNEIEGYINEAFVENTSFPFDEGQSNENDKFHSGSEMPITEESELNLTEHARENENKVDYVPETSLTSIKIMEDQNKTESKDLSYEEVSSDISHVYDQEPIKKAEEFHFETEVESGFVNIYQANDDKATSKSKIAKEEVQIDNEDTSIEKMFEENFSEVSSKCGINETKSLDSEIKNQEQSQNEATSAEEHHEENKYPLEADEVIELSDTNGNKLEDTCPIEEEASEELFNNENSNNIITLMTAAAASTVAVGAAAAVEIESKKKPPESPKKDVKINNDRVTGKPLVPAGSKKPVSDKAPSADKATTAVKASPVKPSSPTKPNARTSEKGKSKESASVSAVKGKPIASDGKSTATSVSKTPLAKTTAKLAPATSNKIAPGGTTKPPIGSVKSVPSTKPTASSVKSPKPAPTKTITATKPSTPPTKLAPGANKNSLTKQVKPTTPPNKVAAGSTKTVASKPLTPTSKTASNTNKSATLTKPATPTSKVAATALKPATPKPAAAAKPAPAKANAGITTVTPSKPSPSTKPASKVAGGDIKSTTKVTSIGKSPSTTPKSPQTAKKLDVTVNSSPSSGLQPRSVSENSVPKSNTTKISTTNSKIGATKTPTTMPKVSTKQAPTDKLKTQTSSKSLNKATPPNNKLTEKKLPAGKKISTTADKNAKNVTKVITKEATAKTSPELIEEETVSSTTDDLPVDTGNLTEINELSPQIIVNSC